MEPFFIAQVCLFGGNFAPSSWAFCRGQLISIAQNDALFAIIGITYGGDGQVTFGLPDFRGRIPVGAGTGAGLSPILLGEMGGLPTHTLLTSQMPAHTHAPVISVGVSSASGNSGNPAGATLAVSSANHYGPAANANATMAGSSISVALAGGSQPFSKLMPYLGSNFIIALEGIFPSRN